MTELFVEIRDICDRDHIPIIVPIEELEDNPSNFRSTYMYERSVAESIVHNGNTRGLSGKPVVSDTLYIDVDDSSNVPKVRSKLVELGCQFIQYSTGNRGKHFHIPIKRMSGINVIYSQLEWMRSNGILQHIDTSIYREGGQYRRVGAEHAKTKRPKAPELRRSGHVLEIPMKIKPPVKTELFTASSSTPAKVQNFYLNLLQQRGEGMRHSHMFIIWRSGLQAGFDRDTIGEAIMWWNSIQEVPHKRSIVEQKVSNFR